LERSSKQITQVVKFIYLLSLTDFPDQLVTLMQSYQPVMLESLQETIRATQRELADLKNEFRLQENWKQEFRDNLKEFFHGLVELKGQVHDLKTSLEEERKPGNLLSRATRRVWRAPMLMSGICSSAVSDGLLWSLR